MMQTRTSGLPLALATACVATVIPVAATAQDRVPLCVPAASQRLLSGAALEGGGNERILALPLASPGPHGERFVVALHDGGRAIGADGARVRDEAMAALAGTPSVSLHTEPGRTVVVRLDADGSPVGAPEFLPDPSYAPGPAIPSGVTLAGGVLLLEILRGELFATVVPPSGPTPRPARVLAAPSADAPLVLFTVAPRHGGAVALAQSENGQVFSLRFDTHGVADSPYEWPHRVGGPLQLLPLGDGPVAALLGRPLEGLGPSGEVPRRQVLVSLDASSLAPAGEPVDTGFAQFPLAMVRRDDRVTVIQWAYRSGFAAADFTVGSRGNDVRVQTPTVYPARPTMEGEPAGHAAVLGAGGVIYDVALYEQLPGGGVVGRLLWIPSPASIAARADILPLRVRPTAPPAVLPADDGVLVLTAGNDETGGALDAVHVRCDLVTLPQR